jgi:hypothetical protein
MSANAEAARALIACLSGPEAAPVLKAKRSRPFSRPKGPNLVGTIETGTGRNDVAAESQDLADGRR